MNITELLNEEKKPHTFLGISSCLVIGSEGLIGELFFLIDHLSKEEALEFLLTAYFADGEDIAEGGAEELLINITPYLKSQGITITKIEDTEADSEDRQNFELDITFCVKEKKAQTERLTIWRKAEASSIDCWTLSKSRTFNFINKLLIEAESNQRFVPLNYFMQLFLPKEITIHTPDRPFHHRINDTTVIENPD